LRPRTPSPADRSSPADRHSTPTEGGAEGASAPSSDAARPSSYPPPHSASVGEPPNGAEPPWDEEFLREVDRIQDDLASQSTPPPPPPARSASPPDWREDVPDPDADGSPWGTPSPYLEERLSLARGAASRLSEQARRVEENLSGLQGDLATIDRELNRAVEEIHSLWPGGGGSTHADGPVNGEPGPSTAPSPSVGPRGPPSGGVSEGPSSPSVEAPTGSFPDFTVARYNETVSALHDRRRSIGWGTVVIAIGISALLFVLTLRADEPVPVIWLAVLPLVWMIPVPFFIAAFRGTQRVLRNNRLELPEDR